MMEPSTSKINIMFPFVVCGILCKLRGVYLEVPSSVYGRRCANDYIVIIIHDNTNISQQKMEEFHYTYNLNRGIILV